MVTTSYSVEFNRHFVKVLCLASYTMDLCWLRKMMSLTIKHRREQNLRPLFSRTPVPFSGSIRGAHMLNLTKNMQYISNDKVKLQLDPKTLKLNQNIEKPLCIMMNYMLAKPKHVLKYADLYLTHGVDVIAVSCSPWQLIWPIKGSQVVADRLLRFLEVNDCGSSHPLMVHGFSVGAYMWGELLVQVTKDKDRYQPIMDRFVGQVWDSAADISEIVIGVPTAVFPENQLMQKMLRSYMEYHMKTFYDAATIHYIRSSQMFHMNLCRAPALFLLSRSDPVGAEKSNRSVHDSWVEIGIKCTWKCWDKSPHVRHYLHHSEEYVAAFYEHFNNYGLISQPEKVRLRL